ncbi:hypothetical protein LG299_02730 [Microbacterium lacus]|uniref:hypothetical protein n=1 Tax=Microbacterium lacus TaxID=415217 RepID=UPI00384B0905
MTRATITGRYVAPDGTPASGAVLIDPVRVLHLSGGAHTLTVVPKRIRAELDADGAFTRELVPAEYDVTFLGRRATIPRRRVELLPTHTAEAPLDLALIGACTL